MKILDGLKTSQAIKKDIAAEVKKLVKKGKKRPHLAAVLVGDNGASITYVNAKIKDCEEVGFKSSLVKLPETTTQEELLKHIDTLNNNADLDGYIVQLPLPKHIDEQTIKLAINPKKDVDGFHPENIGRLVLGLPSFLPATPYGIIKLLEHYKIETSGKHTVVIGRSQIVGSPLSILMARNSKQGNSTVTLTHSRTKNLKKLTLQADIIVAALGKTEFLTADMVKEGAIVIDVGITRVKSTKTKSGWKILGDVKFDEVAEKCSYITPVPGGVGPMTRAGLLLNTLQSVLMK
ncbi:MAG: bifunctional 5,10-methylenetetrahydrofolate dehydrogenase/5,10-methenyltetrahydrofolate cyclohydrolase [Bacteroidia bacterium]